MTRRLLGIALGSFCWSISPALAEINVHTPGGYCSDPYGITTLMINFEWRGEGRQERERRSISLLCGVPTSETVYMTADAYCTVTSSGCPTGRGSISCYQGNESNGTDFNLICLSR